MRAGVILLVSALVAGCSIPKPMRPGKAVLSKPAGEMAVTQPENPAAPTIQKTETAEETSFVVPAGALVKQAETFLADGKTNVTEMTFTTPAPMPVRRVRSEKTDQQIGAAQKDMAREVGAKLASMRPVQFVGILFILAAVAMFHPLVKALVGSRTVQLVTGGTGIALVALPILLVGNERLILLAALVPAVWWIIHRNASKSTEVRVLREFIDKDGDGLDDRTGKPKDA